MLAANSPMILKLKRTPGIYLVGFMASGKTTIGRLLAEELGWYFADLDEDIVAAQGAAIVEIFDTVGEEEFRKTEHEAIRKRVAPDRARTSPWWWRSAAARSSTRRIQEFLIENGVTVWLDCPFERVCAPHRRIIAPAAGARSGKVQAALSGSPRRPMRKAEYRIEIHSDDPAAVVAAILKLPVF